MLWIYAASTVKLHATDDSIMRKWDEIQVSMENDENERGRN